MLSDRVQRHIDRLLDEADQAIALRQWEELRATCETLLSLDPDNSDATRYLALADKSLAADVVSGSSYVIETKEEDGRTPLHAAAFLNSLDVASLLIDDGADIEAVAGLLLDRVLLAGRRPPIHTVASEDYRGSPLEVASLLIDRGADIESVRSLLFDRVLLAGRLPPLHTAARENSLEVASPLIDLGVDIEAKDRRGKTALHLAAEGNSLDIARLLIERGANIEAKDLYGKTPLHPAALLNSCDVVSLLIECGADIEAKDSAGWTPLYTATLFQALNVASLLLDHGADIEAKDRRGKTALHLAAEGNSLDIARLLIERGANTKNIYLKWMKEGFWQMAFPFGLRRLDDVRTIRHNIGQSVEPRTFVDVARDNFW